MKTIARLTKANAKICCVTSGGKIEEIAKKNNFDLIKITKSGGNVVDKTAVLPNHMKIEYASSKDEFLISKVYQKYGSDAVQRYQLKYVAKNINRGCPLVGVIHQLYRGLR